MEIPIFNYELASQLCGRLVGELMIQIPNSTEEEGYRGLLRKMAEKLREMTALKGPLDEAQVTHVHAVLMCRSWNGYCQRWMDYAASAPPRIIFYDSIRLSLALCEASAAALGDTEDVLRLRELLSPHVLEALESASSTEVIEDDRDARTLLFLSSDLELAAFVMNRAVSIGAEFSELVVSFMARRVSGVSASVIMQAAQHAHDQQKLTPAGLLSFEQAMEDIDPEEDSGQKLIDALCATMALELTTVQKRDGSPMKDWSQALNLLDSVETSSGSLAIICGTALEDANELARAFVEVGKVADKLHSYAEYEQRTFPRGL